jgi:hypothetical protein
MQGGADTRVCRAENRLGLLSKSAETNLGSANTSVCATLIA